MSPLRRHGAREGRVLRWPGVLQGMPPPCHPGTLVPLLSGAETARLSSRCVGTWTTRRATAAPAPIGRAAGCAASCAFCRASCRDVRPAKAASNGARCWMACARSAATTTRCPTARSAWAVPACGAPMPCGRKPWPRCNSPGCGRCSWRSPGTPGSCVTLPRRSR